MSKAPRTETNDVAADAMQRRIEAAKVPADFVLTDYTRLKGCSCKIPQDHLLALLRTAAKIRPGEDVGMDCSIVEVKSAAAKRLCSEPLYLVSTTDFFFPSVEDAYIQGAVGAANVLSDMYSMGIVDVDNVLMLLASSTDMETDEADAVTRDMMKGFIDKCKEAGTEVTGGQSVRNPWPLIGGVAMTVAAASEMIRPDGMSPGDVLVLTKPLGTQLAVNLRQWVHRPSPLYKKNVEHHMTPEEIDSLYQSAARSMAFLNANAAREMRRFGAHAATDVTGFGILGHSRNLAMAQKIPLTISIDVLPILAGAIKGEALIEGKYKLLQGLSAETSGGLLVAFPSQKAAEDYQSFMAQTHRQTTWIVGRAAACTEGEQPTARISPTVQLLPVAHFP